MNNGLTAERMMDSFPLALQKDPKMVALAHSIANVLEQRLDEIDLGQIYTRIDQLPEDLLDILAKDFAVDWYDKAYTLEEKRKTIKGSWYVHRHRGTKAAVEVAIAALYPNPVIEEWFDYDGLPYHFRLRIPVNYIDTAKHEQICRKIICYKNLRSHLDVVIYEIAPAECSPAYVAAAPFSMVTSCVVRMPGIIKPRAVTARGYAAGAMSAAWMRTTVELPGAIHPKNITAQAFDSGGLAHTHETVTIKLGGKSL